MLTTQAERDFESLTFADLEADPYPVLKRLRAEAPLAYIPGAGGWLATSYELVQEIHENTEIFKATIPEEPLVCMGAENILSLEGPRHLRYRKAVHKTLSRPSVDSFADRVIGEVVEERLSMLDGLETSELLTEYFEPMSVLSVARVIGVPHLDIDTLRRWFYGLILGTSNVTLDMDIARKANKVSLEIDETVRPVFEKLDKEPDGSVMSHLLQYASGDTLQERIDDITPTLKIIIAGGLQEPGHGAATLTDGLLTHPESLRKFQEDTAGQIQSAVEEGLRWVSPVGANVRQLRNDAVVAGRELAADTFVLASLSSANRDETVYGANSAVFDITRPESRHMAFGVGMHHCSGNYFGRVAIRMAVKALFDRYPDMRLNEEFGPTPYKGFVFRAPTAVNVKLGTRA
ncbi:MAG TPA: cytochrome P450 [Pseudolysinimonas sp.]|nr:cytochrome P450 [Pseudolysinimonas sp.]